MSENDWAVFRQDFTGNEFLVEQGLSEDRAQELVAEFESHKHHQHYWARRLSKSAIDFVQMLREQLANGSTLESSLQVLVNQGGSMAQCIEALREARELEWAEAQRLVVDSAVFAERSNDPDATNQ